MALEVGGDGRERASCPSRHRRSHGFLPLDSVDPNKLYTLSGFAGAISMNDKSMTQARDASLERIRQDKAREKNGKSIEIPDSEEGEHGKRGAKYSRAALGGGGITAQTKDEEGEPPATASEAQRSATPYTSSPRNTPEHVLLITTMVLSG